jgi:hypothetical protein
VELSYDRLAGASDNGVPNLLAVMSPPYHLLRRILDNTTAAYLRSADLYPRNRVDPGTLLAAAKGLLRHRGRRQCGERERADSRQ